MRRLETCCCCGSLRVGTIVSGVLGILLSIITILLIFLTNLQFKTIVLDWLPQWIVDIILVINLVMTILISIALIIGAVKKRSFFMLPWVVLGIMLAIGLLVSVIYTSIVLYIGEKPLEGSLMLVFGLLYVLIFLYLWAVVFSFYLDVKDEEKRGRYSKAPYVRR